MLKKTQLHEILALFEKALMSLWAYNNGDIHQEPGQV